jgi:CspA family cold shock protein
MRKLLLKLGITVALLLPAAAFAARYSGTVESYNTEKGYGMIEPDDGGSKVFVHHADIVMEGMKTLKAGDRVDYDMVEGRKGRMALKVTLVGRKAAE